MNIFEKLNILLTESEGVSKVKESDIPIHPEMETKEQGKIAAAEKILKLFQKLSVSSGGEEEVKDSKPEIPDDMIDPMMKKAPKPSKEKTFEKNKLAGWDEMSDEKIKKEVDVDDDDTTDDEFDDFDYRNNHFGDEDDMDETSDYDDDDMSEDEKLKESIEDAIDSLGGDDSSSDEEGDDSGADWGDDDEEGDDSGEGNGQQGESGDDSKGNSSEGNGQQGGQQGESGDDSNEGEPSKSSTKNGGKYDSKSEKKKRLEDLKKSLDSDGMEDFEEKMDEIKNSTNIPEEDDTPGGQIEKPSDDAVRNDMKKAGVNDDDIEKMIKEKNINGNEEYSEEEMEKLKKDVVDGLEKSCKKKGGSALASTIVKNSLKRKINNDEWKEMLKVFLRSKSIGVGKMSTSNKGIKWGHKNHLWRDSILPTSSPSKGTIQNIYCFVDFSGSVEQDLVYTFLGKVIDMCVELKYSTVHVYGFGERLVEPRILDKKALKNGTDVALSQTWDYIQTQVPGGATENFKAVAEEINKIKRKEKDAVFLIFGDALWNDLNVGPICLKYDIMNNKYLKDICVLAYYTSNNGYWYRSFAGTINILKDIVGIEHIITTKAESIHT